MRKDVRMRRRLTESWTSGGLPPATVRDALMTAFWNNCTQAIRKENQIERTYLFDAIYVILFQQIRKVPYKNDE